MSNARRLMVLGLALMMALALAAPALAQGAGQAQVRVAHLAPDAPNVDVYVNDEPVLTDVPYTTISDYLSLPAGTQQVTVFATGDTTSPRHRRARGAGSWWRLHRGGGGTGCRRIAQRPSLRG